MTVARCHIPALKAAATTPLDAESFRAARDTFPEVCPHNDCSPGKGCREVVTPILRFGYYSRRRK